ncbi:MAG: glycosyltransferase family 2 protein, partial [Deltaproteobacteria bacterium]
MSGVKSQAPIVSAMMPAHNVEKYIGEAIESVLAQTFGDWELIVVDDGSTDRTPEIIREYARKDFRIRAHFMEHGGRGSARNLCLEHSRGRYIAVCDSDDISLPRRYEKEVAFLDTNPEYGVVSAQSNHFSDTVQPRSVYRYPCDTGEIR